MTPFFWTAERAPFDKSSLRSVYHVRNVDVHRMKCLSKSPERIDLFLSHDWPLGVAHHGNTEALLRKKPYFRAEVEQNSLGSPPNRDILDTIQPKWWFSAHLHVKFMATLKHSKKAENSKTEYSLSLVPSQVSESMAGKLEQKGSKEIVGVNGEERAFEVDTSVDNVHEEKQPPNANTEDVETTFLGLESSSARCVGPDLTDQMTKFLALDKCLPRRQYLSIMHVPSKVPREEARLEYDAEWLAIIRKTHNMLCTERRKVDMPADFVEISNSEINDIKKRLEDRHCSEGLAIPDNFSQTVSSYHDPMFGRNCPPLPMMGNPQTDSLLGALGLEHLLTVPFDPGMASFASLQPEIRQSNVQDDNEIDIDNLSEENEGDSQGKERPKDDNEIEIDDLSEASDAGENDLTLDDTTNSKNIIELQRAENSDAKDFILDPVGHDHVDDCSKTVSDEGTSGEIRVKRPRVHD